VVRVAAQVSVFRAALSLAGLPFSAAWGTTAAVRLFLTAAAVVVREVLESLLSVRSLATAAQAYPTQ